jgi:TolB-like protein/Flp pilus assembly protein TadD
MLLAADNALQSEQLEAAFDFARRALAEDELNEEAHRVLIRCFAAAGRRTEALRHYEVLKTHLASQLGVAPEADTYALMDRIRRSSGGLVGGGGTAISPDSLGLPDIPSIAVMPFTAVSGAAAEETIAEGLAEDIVTALSKVSRILVVARASTKQYKNKEADPQRVSREQGVRHILNGAVQRGRDQVRVTAQLIDATTGHQKWADRFDLADTDFLSLQDEMTREVVSALQVQLTDGEQARVWARGTKDVRAWENIVRATAIYHSHHRDELPIARELAIEATRLDPDYAAAWSALGWTHWVAGRWNCSGTKEQSFSKALDLAHRSLALDPYIPDGLILLGVSELHLGHPDEALATFERARVALPNHANVAALSAYSHSYAGDPVMAIGEMHRAIRLSPSHPAWYLNTLARGHWLNGDAPLAIHLLQESIRRDPAVTIPYVNLVAILSEEGRVDEAGPVMKELVRLEPQFSTGAWCSNNPIRSSAQHRREVTALIRAGLPA